MTGKLDAEFPLYVWQSGSGTQSSMNVGPRPDKTGDYKTMIGDPRRNLRLERQNGSAK